MRPRTSRSPVCLFCFVSSPSPLTSCSNLEGVDHDTNLQGIHPSILWISRWFFLKKFSRWPLGPDTKFRTEHPASVPYLWTDTWTEKDQGKQKSAKKTTIRRWELQTKNISSIHSKESSRNPSMKPLHNWKADLPHTLQNHALGIDRSGWNR